MLDEANVKDVGQAVPAGEPEEVRAEPAAEEPAVAAPQPEEAGEAAPQEHGVAMAAPVEKEPEKTGFHSGLDGIEVEFELQYRDRETDIKDIACRVREDYARRGKDASGIELIQVYLKPTDFTAYYVINNSYEGKIPLF